MAPRPIRALARCHQNEMPIIDAAGRRLAEGARVMSGRGRPDAPPEAGTVLHIFEFGDTQPPDLEVRLDRGPIVCHYSRLTGGCWKFDTVALEVV